MLMEIANWQLKHCKIQICPVKVCKFVYNKVALFSLSKFQSVIPYTHVPTGKTFSLTTSIVLFPDPLETTASKPHRMTSQSVPNLWVLSVPNQVNTR